MLANSKTDEVLTNLETSEMRKWLGSGVLYRCGSGALERLGFRVLGSGEDEQLGSREE